AAATFRGAIRFWLNEFKLRSTSLLEKGRARSQHGWEWLQQRARELFKEASKRSGIVRSLLGLPDEPTADTKPSTEKASRQLDTENVNVPPVYRRLFAVEPLEVDEFMVARDQSFAALNDAYSDWMRGDRTSVLIYGDPGTGKRSLLNVGL